MISAVVLAAGRSTRMGGGRPKVLLPLRGRPLLQAVLDVAEGAPVDEVLLVLGEHAGAVWAALSPGPKTRVVRNPEASAGQSTSLRRGLLAASPEAQAAVVLLGDQPEVRPDAVAGVVSAFTPAEGIRAVQATYGGVPGHPVLLARPAWDEAAAVEGDRGARDLLRPGSPGVLAVEVGGEPPADVDTEEDYRALLARSGEGGPEPSSAR